MRARTLTIIFMAAFLGFLVAGLPLAVAARIFVGGTDLSYGHASGTVWSGTLHNAAFGDHRLGDLNLNINPIYLALARARFGFEFGGEDGAGDGILELGIGSYLALKETRFDVDVTKFNRDLALTGNVRVERLSMVLDGGACRQAEGQLSTDVLAANAPALGWEGPKISGVIQCRAGAIHVPMSGMHGAEFVEIETQIFADRRYETRIAVTTEDVRLAQVLSALGFSDEEGVLALIQAGRWAESRLVPSSTGG